jgi:hypothetical protein
MDLHQLFIAIAIFIVVPYILLGLLNYLVNRADEHKHDMQILDNINKTYNIGNPIPRAKKASNNIYYTPKLPPKATFFSNFEDKEEEYEKEDLSYLNRWELAAYEAYLDRKRQQNQLNGSMDGLLDRKKLK